MLLQYWWVGVVIGVLRGVVIPIGELEELLIDAWRIQAPKSLVAEFEAGHRT
jgi:hypothetical protein